MKKILVVEDSDATRQLIADLLTGEGHEVFEASSGFEALRTLAAQRFDLVVTDINMPGLTGLDVIRFCAERYPDLPVIVVSTDTALEDRQRALDLGAADYVNKPFDPAGLVETCHRHLFLDE